MIDPKLNDKVALITGANHGIGAATALALGKQGVKVFASFFRPPRPYSETELQRAEKSGVGGDVLYRAMQQKPISELVNQFRDAGMTISALEADLADETNISKLFEACEEEALAKSTPLGRVGKPEDVADVTVFLCSEQARWLTGQLLYVGGGHRIPQ